MQHSEFRIGEHFYLARTGETPYSRWRVTDVGTRTVVAIRVDKTTVSSYPRRGEPRVLSEAEADAGHWFSGPPYAVAEVVFDEDDIEGAAREIEDL